MLEDLEHLREKEALYPGITPPSHIQHSMIYPRATFSPWLSDKEFYATYERIKNHTMVDIYRLYELYSLAKSTISVGGDILEVGVWRGGSGAILSEAVKKSQKKIFLADTFSGVVKAGENDTNYKGGEHANTSMKIVQNLIKNLELRNVTILEGIFPDDTALNISGKISILHCDVDVYESSKDIVEWCLPRLSVGGIIIFDDYGFSGCEGVTTYCEQLRSNSDFFFIHNLNGHAIFVRLK